MPLSRRTSRALVLIFVAIVVSVSAWMTYVLITETSDPENQRRLEEVEREAAAAARADTIGTERAPRP